MGKFPYTIKIEYAKLKDKRCCAETGTWYFYRCKHKVKEYIDGIGLCGIHARNVKNWRKIK